MVASAFKGPISGAVDLLGNDLKRLEFVGLLGINLVVVVTQHLQATKFQFKNSFLLFFKKL
jgi:hypothetical protein